MKSTITKPRHLKKLMFVISCLILAITTSSWNTGDKKIEKMIGNRIEKNLPIMPDPIKLEACTFSAQQLKNLLQDHVRKILFEYYNDAQNHTILIAYGVDKDNNKLTGPEIGTYMSGHTYTVPPAIVMGNQELKRGSLKYLYGYRRGRHETIKPETLIVDLEFYPNKNAAGQIIYKVVNPVKRDLDPQYTNPSPPARPCDGVECEESL